MAKHTFPAFGCWLNIFHPVVAELVGLAGYDFVLIDMEHSPTSTDALLPIIQAAQLGGARPIVRAPDNDPQWVGRLMDIGAKGIMLPMVNTAAQAKAIAAAALYAPAGTRGMAAPLVRGAGYGAQLSGYMDRCRDDFMIFVQIETAEAVANAVEILSVPGIDVMFIGPYDLSGSLGNAGQPDHPVTQQAIEKVLAIAATLPIKTSTLPTPNQSGSDLLAAGYDVVFSGTDLGMLREAMLADAATQKALIEKLAI